MSLPGIVLTTADGRTGGAKYTRLAGPVLSGVLQDVSGGPVGSPGGFICVQTTAALATQLITTTGQFAETSFVYIPQGTLGATSSGTANISESPPYTGSGAALYFDITRRKLSIFSTGVGDWLSVTLSSS